MKFGTGVPLAGYLLVTQVFRDQKARKDRRVLKVTPEILVLLVILDRKVRKVFKVRKVLRVTLEILVLLVLTVLQVRKDRKVFKVQKDRQPLVQMQITLQGLVAIT